MVSRLDPSYPRVHEVIDKFRAYHERNLAWGALHLVLDDRNIGDDSVRFCIEYGTEVGDAEGADLARILLQMSKTQRARLADEA